MTFIFIAIGVLAILMIYLFTVTDRIMDVINGLQSMIHAQSEAMKNNLDLTAEVMNETMNELNALKHELEALQANKTKKKTTKKDSE